MDKANIIHQEAWDYLTISADACLGSEAAVKRGFEGIAKRIIEEANNNEDAEPGLEIVGDDNNHLYFMRDLYFTPTEDERGKLIEYAQLHQAFKTLHKEYSENYEHTKITGKKRTAFEKVDHAFRISRDKFFWKSSFYVLVTITCIKILFF